MKTRDLIYCALFAALTAIGAFIHFQFMHATITLQCFFTAMAGLLLGARLGALSQALYVGLGLVGPVSYYTSPSPRDRQKSRMPSSA